MSLREDWEDVKRLLRYTPDASTGNLDEDELREYTESLATIPKYAAGLGGSVGFLMGKEVGLYSDEDLSEAIGLEGWEDFSDFDSIWPIATASSSGAISGGIALYGTKIFAEYVQNKHDYEKSKKK